MRHLLPVLASFLVISGSVSAADSQRVEAETTGVGSRIDDPAAFGGAATTGKRPWEPLLKLAAPPAGAGDEVVLWIRQRGGPLQLKAVTADGQRELSWNWGKPKEWTWIRYTAKRADVALGALVIRSGDGDAPAIDAAMWAQPTDAAPEDPAPAGPVAITVDWTTPVGVAGAMSYGLNIFRGGDPAIAGDARYQAGMQRMQPGLVRFWTAEQMSEKSAHSWLDHTTKAWKRDYIAAALKAFSRGQAQVMVTVGGIPPWMDVDHDSILDAGQESAWSALAADLVRIVNVELKYDARWWEITNEWDDAYHNHLIKDGKPSRIAEVGALHVLAAAAMKAVDPTIKTGGLAAARPDRIEMVRDYVRAAKTQLDFVSYHAYASGNAADADAYIFGPRIRAFHAAARDIALMVKTEMGRELPTFFDEFNISWTWQTRDPRMLDHKGALFDALALAAGTLGGATGMTAWNEMDGIYGKIGNDFVLRPHGDLFHLLNSYGRGDLMQVTPDVTAPDSPVVAYAVRRSDGGRTLMLINRINAPVTLTGAAAMPGVSGAARISERGFQAQVPLADAVGVLPRHSVTIVW